MSNVSETRPVAGAPRRQSRAPTTIARTEFAVSRDGTRIAYTQQGAGRPLILVDGALCHRAMGPSAALAKGAPRLFHVHHL